MTVEKLKEIITQKNWPDWKVENLLGYFEDNFDLRTMSSFEIEKLISNKVWEINDLVAEEEYLEQEVYILQNYLEILDENENEDDDNGT